jgi:hypothetical protein
VFSFIIIIDASLREDEKEVIEMPFALAVSQ